MSPDVKPVYIIFLNCQRQQMFIQVQVLHSRLH
jgi:hypothetical protein